MRKPLMYCVVGTRPELIKMAPVMRAFEQLQCNTYCLHTAQHTHLVAQACENVGVNPDLCLLPRPQGLSLSDLLATLVTQIAQELREHKPAAVLVHGDTSTAWAAAQAAFYVGIPVAHVEAGLRCPTLSEPFPEEAHRRLIARLARWHFAPTESARCNLNQEGISENIVVTGNTAIDSIMHLTQRWSQTPHKPSDMLHKAWHANDLMHTAQKDFQPPAFRLLVTSHRRENWGKPIEALITALARWLSQSEKNQVVWIKHANPELAALVSRCVAQTISDELKPRFNLLPALSYADTVWALANCDALATDSGGLQEEASAFFKPVLILRNTTERPEAVAAGYARLTGCHAPALLNALNDIAQRTWPPSPPAEWAHRWPFGDGRAGLRIAHHLLGAIGS